MRRLPRTTWIAIVVIGILTLLASVTGNIGATALTWLSPKVALVLFVLISLVLIGVSLWQERQKAASEPSAADTRKYREIMLGRVENKWITGFLENPLYYGYDEQLLPLALRKRVGSRFDLVLSNPLEPMQTISPDTTLAQVFDQAGGELLILGEAGAGKTTLLLKLARDLLKRAKDNEVAPIPVMLMLASWAIKQLPLEQWIIEELRMEYDIPSQIGKEWVKANQLLLLLDGLDEVTPDALPACIEAINAYYYKAHRSLVVCSRTREFLDQLGRLALHTAVMIQSLSPEQVDTYLDGLAAKGEEIEGLKYVLSQSKKLRVLATTPLFLTVLILAYHSKPEQELLALARAMPTDQQHLIFHDYVERVLQREGTHIHVPAQQAKHWLAWVADQLTGHHQTELYLEYLRPDWLPERQRVFYQLSLRLFLGLAFGLLILLYSGLVVEFSLSNILIQLEMDLPPTPNQATPNQEIWRLGRNGLFFGLLMLLVIGMLVIGMLAIGVMRGALSDGLTSGLTSGLVGGLTFGLGAFLQHFTLRFWLWQARCTPAPWRYVAFLDYAVEQLLLRKVGGGYIFRHSLLQDYFASLDVVPPHHLSVRAEARSALQNAPDDDPSV